MRSGPITGVKDVAGQEDITGNLAFAGYVFENWPMKERFLGLRSPVGKKEDKWQLQIRLRIC